MNVYVPKSANQNKPLPVIVYIHGGSFKTGSADPGVFGPDYFMDTKEVIVVTIQYRLGVFGFLASGDENCQGNFGLKDQNLALRWVRKNIRAFGGDSHKITLMGQSVGAASVQYQMLSEQSNGLFQKAILMSGTAGNFWSLTKDPETIFRRFAATAQVPLAYSQKSGTIVDSLRKKSARELLEYQNQMWVFHRMLGFVHPVVEGNWRDAFIREDPEYIWESCKYQQRPFLTGVNGYEQGAWDDMYRNKTLRDDFLASPGYMLSTGTEIPLDAVQPLLDFYFGGRPTKENADQLAQYLSDNTMAYPMWKMVKEYTQCGNVEKRPVDLYFFNFTSAFSLSQFSNPYPNEGKGAAHTDEQLYLFRYKDLDMEFKRGSAEKDMKDYFVRYIVNYVTQGVKYSGKLKRCSIEFLEDDGFCDYLNIQRKNDNVDVTVSNKFYPEMIKALQKVDRIISQLDDQSFP